VLAYGLTDDRLRYRLGLAVAPVMLLILPNGHGLATLFKPPGYVIDVLLTVAGIWWLVQRRRSPVPQS